MKHLEYLLKEGFIEIVYYPKDLQKFSRRIKVYLNKTPNVKMIDSNLGKCIIDTKTGDMLVLDTEMAVKYGTQVEVVENLDLLTAVAALKQ